MKICIINYGIGNIKSLYDCLSKLHDVKVESDPSELKKFDKFFLPGVGSYKNAMKLINSKNWNKYLEEEILKKKKYIFGICVGMQILTEFGYEFGKTKGLGFIDGETLKLDDLGCKLNLPHIGWNEVKISKKYSMFKDIKDKEDFYFVNSYCVLTKKNNVSATAIYDVKFTAAIEKNNVFGTQFHPEKSSFSGLKILKNFINA